MKKKIKELSRMENLIIEHKRSRKDLESTEERTMYVLKHKVENLAQSFNWSASPDWKFRFGYHDFSVEFYKTGEYYLGVCVDTLWFSGINCKKAEGPFWPDDKRLSWLRSFEEELGKLLNLKHFKIRVYFNPRLIEQGNV